MSSPIGGVYVINLDRRKDRLREITQELSGVGLPFTRFSAIETRPGIHGCGLSHMAILKEAKRLGLKNVLIFEDDFTFLVSKDEFWASINDFFSSGQPFDVLMLSYAIQNSVPHSPGILKVLEAQTASGYIVHERFYDQLIAVYEDAMPKLLVTGHHWIYANDQVWKKLQPTADWFAFAKRQGKQRASYNDAGYEQTYADYGI
jgi:glycosyl transferase family 25